MRGFPLKKMQWLYKPANAWQQQILKSAKTMMENLEQTLQDIEIPQMHSWFTLYTAASVWFALALWHEFDGHVQRRLAIRGNSHTCSEKWG